MENLRVALVHDHLMKGGGAERVLGALSDIFPSAPIYVLYSDAGVYKEIFLTRDVRTTFLQKFPKVFRKRFKTLAPLAVAAIENIDLSDYDVVISSSAFVAKGVITSSNSIHICYCHTPARAIWGIDGVSFGVVLTALYHFARIWDTVSSSRVDRFIANSETTRLRIKKYYNRDADVVYPPVSVLSGEKGKLTSLQKKFLSLVLPKKFFLCVCGASDHKKMDVVLDAFNKVSHNVVIIGSGSFKKQASNRKNIIFLGRRSDKIVYECMRRCKAYINASEEDFGIAMAEANMLGKPVLAYRGGGALEIIFEGKNGEFFDAHDAAVLSDGIRRINKGVEQGRYNSEYIKATASRFSQGKFDNAIRDIIKDELSKDLANRFDIIEDAL